MLAGFRTRRRKVSDEDSRQASTGSPADGSDPLSPSQVEGASVAGTAIAADRFWKNEGEPSGIAFSITGGSEAEFAALQLCGEAPFTIRGADPAAILLPVYPVARKRVYEMAIGSTLFEEETCGDDEEGDDGSGSGG